MKITLSQCLTKLEKIAKEELNIETLKTQDSDAKDFHEVSVWKLRAALERAFCEGMIQALK